MEEETFNCENLGKGGRIKALRQTIKETQFYAESQSASFFHCIVCVFKFSSNCN